MLLFPNVSKMIGRFWRAVPRLRKNMRNKDDLPRHYGDIFEQEDGPLPMSRPPCQGDIAQALAKIRSYQQSLALDIEAQRNELISGTVPILAVSNKGTQNLAGFPFDFIDSVSDAISPGSVNQAINQDKEIPVRIAPRILSGPGTVQVYFRIRFNCSY